MVITGLLLICLVLGLLMQSSTWLVASLIATAGAGFLLFRLRAVITAPKTAAGARGGAAAAPQSRPEGDQPGPEQSGAELMSARTDQVWVLDGRPRYHLGDCAIIKGQDAEKIPLDQATEDGFIPCSLCEPYAARSR